MYSDSPRLISRSFLAATGTRLFLHHEDRIPQCGPVLVVSNHRSFMDAPLLMASVGRTIRFACHHYMGQVPVMREIVTRLGCFPLEEPEHRQQHFFHQAIRLLQAQQVVGVFPEGAQPMVEFSEPEKMRKFERGFAHLALRATVPDLVVLPVAIASVEESVNSGVPLKLLSFFDPSEPLFDRSGWHPLVVYRRVNVSIGRPCWISASQREYYQGKQAKAVVAEITQYCQTEIAELLRQGCYSG
ncbi:lysophospholipid acyltransferase family protein [Argonema antarcticum]|uniref:lysophospholipid acyltransferase family protein n=1 Tax=Argonema antarcticum TaxID=2942763 RepID=UPI002011F413|nr:lysophospholipid acyltransferase family protein [Argonema antarcticum]MCL1474406.1 1-acyl-sn-glycerol-3-phosphate acyltransferase [Argonema antarcticum A004/B2]